jgi:hypothetical protein
LWRADPSLGNDSKISDYKELLLDNGSENRQEGNNSAATIALQQSSGVFYAVLAVSGVE